MNITIAFASQEDFKEVRKFDPHSLYIDGQKIKRKIEDQEIILAKDGDVIVGIIKFSYFWATRPILDLIFITPLYRGKSISRTLIDFLVKYLQDQGHDYLFSSSEIKESSAQNWHRHLSFKDMGILTDINLPHSNSGEVFFSLKIADNKKLQTFPII